MNNVDNLLFRRQFIMGSKKTKSFYGWKEILVGNHYFLYCHPDLGVHYIHSGEKELYVLGFMLDPYNPEYNDQCIAEEIISNNETFDDVITYTAKYGGRWALVWGDKTGIKIMNDACGTREIFYYFYENEAWVGSQPAIIAYELGLEMDDDPEIMKFLNSEGYKKTNFGWSGDRTVYKNLMHLLNNHFLDMNLLEAKRFWPKRASNEIEVADAVKEAAHIMEGTLKSITYRYEKVMLSVTAGYDSRMVLAASKAVKDKIKYFFCMDDSNKKSTDFKVSSRLLARLGLKQEIINRIPFDDEFLKLYCRNVTLASTLPFKEFVYKFYKDYPDYVIVSGVSGEIAKNFFYKFYDKEADAESLAAIVKNKGFKFMEESISKWFEEAKSIKNLVNLYDLFLWENINGNWAVKSLSEQDIAIEEIWPFNNRNLLTTMLSVKVSYRIPPFLKLQRKIAKSMWKETLCMPINPNILKKTYWILKNFTRGIMKYVQNDNRKVQGSPS